MNEIETLKFKIKLYNKSIIKACIALIIFGCIFIAQTYPSIIEVLPADARMTTIIVGGGAPAPGGGDYCTSRTTDNFDDNSITGWTTIMGTFSETGQIMTMTDEYAYYGLRNDTTVSGTGQYCSFDYTAAAEGGHGCIFRATATPADTYYVVHTYAGSSWLAVFNASTQVDTKELSAITRTGKIGITIQGTTRDSVTVKLWSDVTNSKPYDLDNWDSASDAADVTGTGKDDANYDISGTRNYVGIAGFAGSESGGASIKMDNFDAGDCSQ